MDINDINWHDTMLYRVEEDTEKSTLILDVDYPTDWENQIWVKRIIRFSNILNYEVHEGPFHGCPTILDASIIGEEDGREIIRIETNAGFRQLAFKTIELK